MWSKNGDESRNCPQQTLIYRSMTLNGVTPVTAINRNMNIDGSSTTQRFRIGPPAGEVWQLTRMIFMMRDDGSFDSGGWGNNGGNPLTNGMTIGLNLDGVEYDQTPVPWTTVADLGAVAYDLAQYSFGQGAEFLTMRLTFSKAGQNLRLIGDNSDYLWMDVNDNLTHLLEQRTMIQGYIENSFL